MSEYKLSILIPTLYSRTKKFNILVEKVMSQIKKHNLTDSIEIIAHYDNKSIGLSQKRTDMLRNAQGAFIAFLDDDDDIGDDYIKLIYATILRNPEADVITFDQHCNCDGSEFFIHSDINYDFRKHITNKKNMFTRFPWIWCVWRRDLVGDVPFTDPDPNRKNYGEDTFWLVRVRPRVKKQIKINKVLHYYRFNSEETETQKF